MKITLITTGSTADKGPRKVAEYLQKYNHKLEVIFYNENELRQTLSKCKNTDLIVVSANVATHKRASLLIQHLKKLKRPTAYAGIYAALHPEECIKETDLVITAKPAETILELANRLENFQRIADIENLRLKFNKKEIIKNA
ncbi:hypothetical protein HYV89_01160 [Candidatus Woesearchaeota archaeon]|nr:hypothetical protein [Candidatus Woesearchaeota archaeon]